MAVHRKGQTLSMAHLASQLMTTEAFRGMTIVDVEGRKLGQIETLIIDGRRGNVILVGALSGEKLVGIPWVLLQAESSDRQLGDIDRFAARIDMSMLDEAPGLVRTEALDIVNLKQWASETFKYFTLDPALVEGGGPGSKMDAPPGP
jgi:hypothetical protein